MPGAAGAVRLLHRSRPLVTSARNCKLQGPVNRAANVLSFRLSRSIVVNSLEVATFIAREYWAPVERIRVIYNGIDMERFHPELRSSRDTLGTLLAARAQISRLTADMKAQEAQMKAQDAELARADGGCRSGLRRSLRDVFSIHRLPNCLTNDENFMDTILGLL